MNILLLTQAGCAAISFAFIGYWIFMNYGGATHRPPLLQGIVIGACIATMAAAEVVRVTRDE